LPPPRPPPLTRRSSLSIAQAVLAATFGIATDVGGRAAQDDRATAFSLRLRDGRRVSAAAVADGHHGAAVAQLAADLLPAALAAALDAHPGDAAAALRAAVRALDDAAYAAHAAGRLPTGGATLLVHLLTPRALYTANVGDCKGVLSARGAPTPLSEAHNPPVPAEAARFAAAGVPCHPDHIGGSDVNVCRSLGDYDLGRPLKWRDGPGAPPAGPLSAEPEVSARALGAGDEFLVAASDGLWDYFTPESTVVTEARRRLRAGADAQAAAEWLVAEAVARQRGLLHAGTAGDNVTVVVVQLRPLAGIPRASASRLNLRRAASDADGAPSGEAAASQAPPRASQPPAQPAFTQAAATQGAPSQGWPPP
jgi:protein phosphatase 2C family protein 2/3